MLVVTRIALLPLGRLLAQLRIPALRRHAAAGLAEARRRLAGGARAALPSLPVLPTVDRESAARALRVAAACCGRAAWRGAQARAAPPPLPLPPPPHLARRVHAAGESLSSARVGLCVQVLMLWLRVAVWVVLFSLLWGASLALVVLATTWIALDVLAVPGQAPLPRPLAAPPPPLADRRQ